MGNIRTVGDLALAVALAIGTTYAVRDIRRTGWVKATFEGSSTPVGSAEDTLAKFAGAGVLLFLLTRLAPTNDATAQG